MLDDFIFAAVRTSWISLVVCMWPVGNSLWTNFTAARSLVVLSSAAERPHSSRSTRQQDLWVSSELSTIVVFMAGAWAQSRRLASGINP
jgi:hypothetical protein